MERDYRNTQWRPGQTKEVRDKNTYPRMSRMSSWLAVCPASLFRRMERGVVGGDVSHRIVALSSWADCMKAAKGTLINLKNCEVTKRWCHSTCACSYSHTKLLQFMHKVFGGCEVHLFHCFYKSLNVPTWSKVRRLRNTGRNTIKWNRIEVYNSLRTDHKASTHC